MMQLCVCVYFIITGEHLPTPPPIPPAIQKALAIIYANAAKQQKQATSSGNRYN